MQHSLQGKTNIHYFVIGINNLENYRFEYDFFKNSLNVSSNEIKNVYKF